MGGRPGKFPRAKKFTLQSYKESGNDGKIRYKYVYAIPKDYYSMMLRKLDGFQEKHEQQKAEIKALKAKIAYYKKSLDKRINKINRLIELAEKTL